MNEKTQNRIEKIEEYLTITREQDIEFYWDVLDYFNAPLGTENDIPAAAKFLAKVPKKYYEEGITLLTGLKDQFVKFGYKERFINHIDRGMNE